MLNVYYTFTEEKNITKTEENYNKIRRDVFSKITVTDKKNQEYLVDNQIEKNIPADSQFNITEDVASLPVKTDFSMTILSNERSKLIVQCKNNAVTKNTISFLEARDVNDSENVTSTFNFNVIGNDLVLEGK